MSGEENRSDPYRRPSKGKNDMDAEKMPPPMEPGRKVDLDYVLETELGQFGWYQLRNLLLVAFPIMMSAFMSEYIFAAAALPHRCAIPECGENKTNSQYEVPWLTGAVPSTSSGIASCERYVAVPGAQGSLQNCPASLFTTETTTCDEYIYERDNSVVYDFDLACNEFMRALAGTLNSVGTLLVLPIAGYVSDKFGRRLALTISVFNLALIGLIKCFSVNYPMYLAMQILQTTLGAGTFSSAYIFATELVGPKYRVFTGASCSAMFAMGQVIMGLVAMGVQPWRYLNLTLAVPCFLVISYYWILTESVRWLLSVQRFDEATKILQNVARVNRKTISEKSIEALTTPPPKQNIETDGENLFKKVIKSGVMVRRVASVSVWWVTTTLVYYGLSINSTSLSDSIYLNYILTCVVEIPGYYLAVLVLNRIGRKITLFCGYTLSAVCNFVFIALSTDLVTARLVVYLLGKFGIAVVFTSVYLFTSELYPTAHRHSLLAFCSMIGRLGSILAPLTPALAEYWSGIPSAMFGTMAVISAILVLTQPETLGTRMPDTMDEAIAIGTKKSKAPPSPPAPPRNSAPRAP